MRKIFLALLLFSGLAAMAQAAEFGTRFASMQNILATPAGATYSLGGYAPADPNVDPNANNNSGIIDKGEYASPPGVGCGCGSGGCNLWDGYQARPCRHRHHWGCGCGHKWGNCGVYGSTCGSGCGCDTGCNTGCGCGGGFGFGGPGYIAPGCGGCGCASPCCAPACGKRHHCHLFHKRGKCCDDVASTGDSCGCGATADSTDSTPTAPQPNPELLEPAPAAPAPAPAPAPGPSASRQPRAWRSMAGIFGN